MARTASPICTCGRMPVRGNSTVPNPCCGPWPTWPRWAAYSTPPCNRHRRVPNAAPVQRRRQGGDRRAGRSQAATERKRQPGQCGSAALNMGISWDGVTERPPVIETFSTQQGRVELDANGLIVLKPLPALTDINFYDYATKGAAGTQAHYANNIYFPRTEPVRCPVDYPNCPQVESPPLRITAGDWKTGGSTPDTLVATHLHGDEATQAGSGVGANGNLVYCPAPTGWACLIRASRATAITVSGALATPTPRAGSRKTR